MYNYYTMSEMYVYVYVCMVRQQWYVHTMSAMCCYVHVYVCMVRQHWYVHTMSEKYVYVSMCMYAW